MERATSCAACGGPLTAGRCPSCDSRQRARLVHRELVLLTVLVGVTVAAFFGTRAVARSNEGLRRRQAAAWFDAAQRAAQEGNTGRAVAGLRRAVSKAPGNTQYRLALAGALAATGLDAEARRTLLELRTAQPEAPEINLQLARLEARGPDLDAARRYFQNALAGLWRPEQAEERRQVRMELIEFLLAHDERARALSELLLLAANLPDDAAIQVRTGRMLLAAGDPRLALDRFVRAVRLDAGNTDALAGAGEAAFELEDYGRALRYLKQASRENPRAASLRELTELVLGGDPLAPRLGPAERRRRLMTAFQQSERQLETCLGDQSIGASAGLEPLRTEARALRAALERPPRRESRDLVETGTDLVYRIERAVEQHCEPLLTPFDRAVLLIGRRHGLEER
jgi:tetratricopeptide (TPR) repeat protein